MALVEAELDRRWPETKIEPSLTRISTLMDLLGSPQQSYPAIHVAQMYNDAVFATRRGFWLKVDWSKGGETL